MRVPLFRDPWAKAEAWRKHPVFSNRAMLRSMFPGFGIAVVAFTSYVMLDNILQEHHRVESQHAHH